MQKVKHRKKKLALAFLLGFILAGCETDLSVECDGKCRISENSKVTGR